MSDCQTCGRDDGHYIGCAEIAQPFELRRRADAPDPEEHMAELIEKAGQCAFGECKNPKRPKGKGPAPKYCEEHSDPKNRK
jgi:hypothetical protein